MSRPPPHFVTLSMLVASIMALAACSGNDSTATPGCRANLGSIEILEVYESADSLHVAGVVQHNCSTPTGIRARFQFFDSAGELLATRTARLTDDTALEAATPREYDWETSKIEGVDSVTAMVIELSRTDVMTVE
jgi:hypothetical protein